MAVPIGKPKRRRNVMPAPQENPIRIPTTPEKVPEKVPVKS